MGNSDGCPSPFAVCFEYGDAVALVEMLESHVAYSRKAWLLCGPAFSVKEPSISGGPPRPSPSVDAAPADAPSAP